MKDYEVDLGHIQTDIDRLRFGNVELALDEKYHNCFKSDLNRLIVVRDELSLRSNNDVSSFSPQSPGFSQSRYEELNPHANRDQIKRSQTKYT